MLIICKLLLS